MQENINTLFTYAISLEKFAEKLYITMGEIFAHEEKIKKFWQQYAKEERGHALYLEKIRKGLTPTQLAPPADSNILKKAFHCLERISTFSQDKIITLEDAYTLAVEFESSETNATFNFMITNFSTADLSKSQNFLRTQLEKHATKLEREFPSPYNSRIYREKLLAKS